LDEAVGEDGSHDSSRNDPTAILLPEGRGWMRTKYLLSLLGLLWLEGLAVLPALGGMTFTPGRGGRFDYDLLRRILTGGWIVFLALLLAAIILLLVRQSARARFVWLLDRLLQDKRLFWIQAGLLVLALFLGECFFLTYLAFPEPAQPFFLWASTACLLTWLAVRLAYAQEYRSHPTLGQRIQQKWEQWTPVQRKTARVMAALCIVYFLAFIPANLMKDANGQFFVHADENILYGDVIKGMVFPLTFSGFAHGVMESWSWQYGYPYFSASAAVLLAPRLLFGTTFATHVELNLLLLRQFVNVLPVLLTMVLVIYLATRFKHFWLSIGAFAFLATVPGLVKFNHQFWHPDALIVLLIVLAIYALQKDRLACGRYFYLAAACCGVAAILKLWGLFFGPVIAVYLLLAYRQKQVTFGQMLLRGGLFLLTMLAAVVITSPTMMAPYIARVALRGWLPRQGALLAGYAPDATGEYSTGLFNWLTYFGFHFMKSYFFFFSLAGLGLLAWKGPSRGLAWILLGWCGVTAGFLAYFVALKNFQYMLPVALPLYAGAFLFTASFLEDGPAALKGRLRKAARAVALLFFGSQWAVNLVILGLYILRGR
jgi:hypothetical protein